MKRMKFRDVILTVNAVLLAIVAWGLIGHAPIPSQTANAQSTLGIPNPAVQRNRMIAALESVDHRLATLEEILLSGDLEVTVAD